MKKVVKRGIIVLDDYGTVAGVTKAVDEFIIDNHLDLIINKSSISRIPANIIK